MFHIQTKLWQDGFQPANLVAELKKVHCPESVPVVLCICATSLGAGLNSCVSAQPSRVLILTSWSATVAAKFTFHGTSLLWRRKKYNTWYMWPSKEEKDQFTGTLAQNRTVFGVRPKLEVIIPLPAIVREVVGPELYDGLVSAQRNRDAGSTASVIYTLDSLLGDEPPRSPASPPDKFRALADEVTMAEAIQMIAQEAGFTEKERDDDIASLGKNRIRTVANLRTLSSARIEGMNISDLLKEYLVRIHSGRR